MLTTHRPDERLREAIRYQLNPPLLSYPPPLRPAFTPLAQGAGGLGGRAMEMGTKGPRSLESTSSTTHPSEDFLEMDDVIRLLKVESYRYPRKFVQRLVHRAGLPVVRLSREHWVFPASDLKKWMRERDA